MPPLWTRDFTIITLGTVVSMFGSAVSGFAIGLLVLDYTSSVFLYALFMVCYSLPRIVLPLLAGPYLDRFRESGSSIRWIFFRARSFSGCISC